MMFTPSYFPPPRFPRFPYHPYHSSSFKKQVRPSFQKEETKTSSCNSAPSSQKNTENSFLELFGLTLYFDDILLICLIFFLYQEGVKDTSLFLCLVLLLLS